MKTFLGHVLFKLCADIPSLNLLRKCPFCLPSQNHLSPPEQEPPPAEVSKGRPGEGETSIIPAPPPDEELPSRRVSFTGDAGASHTRADTRLPRGPALALTPNCTRSRNVARFNARDSKASGTQWEGRGAHKLLSEASQKTTDYADRWGGVGRRGCRI